MQNTKAPCLSCTKADFFLPLFLQYYPETELYKAPRAQGGSSERWKDSARNKSKTENLNRFSPH